MRKLAKDLLERLKSEYPLPSHVTLTLRCYDKKFLVAPTARKEKASDIVRAYVRRSDREAGIHITLRHPVTKIVKLVAHEYYHCYQKYVLNQPDFHPELEPQAVEFASQFAVNYFTRK